MFYWSAKDFASFHSDYGDNVFLCHYRWPECPSQVWPRSEPLFILHVLCPSPFPPRPTELSLATQPPGSHSQTDFFLCMFPGLSPALHAQLDTNALDAEENQQRSIAWRPVEGHSGFRTGHRKHCGSSHRRQCLPRNSVAWKMLWEKVWWDSRKEFQREKHTQTSVHIPARPPPQLSSWRTHIIESRKLGSQSPEGIAMGATEAATGAAAGVRAWALRVQQTKIPEAAQAAGGWPPF